MVLAEGEEERVLHATQELVSQGLAYPILIGRPSVIETRLKNWVCKLRPEKISKWSIMNLTRVLMNTGTNTIKS